MPDPPDDARLRDVIGRETTLRIIAYSALLVAAFVVVGVFAPQLYFQYDDPDHLYDVEEFTAENATTDADSLNVTIVRTVPHAAEGEITANLRILDVRDNRTATREVKRLELPAEFPTGTQVTDFHYPVGDVALEPGQYVIAGTVTMTFQNDVTRHISVRSEEFYVRQPVENETRTQQS